MSGINFRTKSTVVVAVILVLLLAAAIVLPIYISSLDRPAPPEPEAYTSTASLQFKGREFSLQGNKFRIISGAVHYFRSFPDTWNRTLSSLKAVGANTVETYVPWNLHEEYPGSFNFEGILDMRRFIKLAHDLGLYVIFRPGPYICSEWDFGGLPGWLLSDPNMKVRTNYQGYKDAVTRYFDKLLPMVTDLQHSQGGPIIAIQVENEYGSFGKDVEHLTFIRDLYLKHGLKEMFITSDNFWGQTNDPFYKYALPTANFKDFPKEGKALFEQIRKWGNDFPLMVTEFWTGWFDHWKSQHDGLAVEEYAGYLTSILEAKASLNLYMFHGGTNFGFMNGANKFDGSTYKPDVTSYDYDALLSEAGDITPKFLKTRELFLKYIYEPLGQSLPDIPANSTKKSYGTVNMTSFVSWDNILKSTEVFYNSKGISMEMLKLHGNYGQNFGYILYRCDIPVNTSSLKFDSLPNDRAQIFIDDKEVAVIDWTSKPEDLSVSLPQGSTSQSTKQLDILVENHGRVNYATQESGIMDSQRKGLNGSVSCDGKPVETFTIYPLEFKANAVNRSDWVAGTTNATVPGLFQGTLELNEAPADTFVFMKGWGKGILFVNGFNLGRYWSAGPQQTLYLPAQVLKQGTNQLVAFEHGKQGQEIHFLETPILNVNNQSDISIKA